MTALNPTTEVYLDYLKREGFVPQSTLQGIVFKREGLTYILEAAADDASFLRIVLPNIWKVEADAFLESPESYKTAIGRLLPALAYGAQAFGTQIRG